MIDLNHFNEQALNCYVAGVRRNLPGQRRNLSISNIGREENINDLVLEKCSELVIGVDHITDIAIAGHGDDGYIGHLYMDDNSLCQLTLRNIALDSPSPQAQMFTFL